MRQTWPKIVLIAWSVLGLTLPAGAVAQVVTLPGTGAGGISVNGSGELMARPNVVEIDLHINGKAELTGDALVKHRDGRKRVVDALEQLKLKGLTSAEQGLSISVGNALEQQQRIMNGMPATATKPQVEVTSMLRLSLADVRDTPPEELMKTIGRLMDVAQDAGVTLGLSPAELQRNIRYGQNTQMSPVRFVVTDASELRDKASEQAVNNARVRANRLAQLHHVKLGAAVSIQEIPIPKNQQVVNYNPYPMSEEDEERRVTSPNLAEIPVKVRLAIRFAIEGVDPTTAQQ